MAGYPEIRLRRLRRTAAIRDMFAMPPPGPEKFIWPVFLVPGTNRREAIASMPGQFRFSADELVKALAPVVASGVKSVLLFGLPSHKDALGTEAYDDHGVVQEACRIIRAQAPEMYIITDVCLCEYTDHGHCGPLDEAGNVVNDEALKLLADEAVSHAKAGAHMVAPSDMMDGRIGFIRAALDEAGFQDVPIMAYSTKYASGFYGPFRDAADSAPAFGDRRAYQMDPANAEEGVREAAYDIAEGADLVMVKPALSYLDVIQRVKSRLQFPTVAYNVSGEYSMVKAAAANDWIDEKRVVLELLTSIKRAGADMIITYHAKEASRWLAE